MMLHQLICPVCTQALEQSDTGHSVVCANGHLFDYAKQGYLNLLLSQHKKSKHPGDTADMVQARSAFLNSGFYQGIADFLIMECLSPLITDITGQHTDNEHFRYCDLACGEGYYTQQIHQYLSATHAPGVIVSSGIDISSPAIKAACKRDKRIQWLVASLARSPLADHSQDLVSGLFFHFDLQEIRRILKPGAYFVMVTTGPKHLIELRELIYDRIKPELNKDFSQPECSGPLEHKHTLHYTEKKQLTGQNRILELLAMTPHYWRCKPEKKKQLATCEQLGLTLDIQIDVFQHSMKS